MAGVLNMVLPLLALTVVVSAIYIKPLTPFNGVIISDQLPGMDADCLRCLCNDKVGSNCHQPTVCTDPGTEFCDLIYFDIDYWTKAGRLVRAGDSTDNIDAYINCRRSTDCAARTVLSFLEVSRNETGDCNDDGIIDCIDYASVHFYGVDHCKAQVMQGYRKNELQQCLCASAPRTTKCAPVLYANHRESAVRPQVLAAIPETTTPSLLSEPTPKPTPTE